MENGENREQSSKRETLAVKIAGAVIAAEYFLCFNNYNGLHTSGMHNTDKFAWLPIKESNFGDTPEMFAAILASGFLGNKIEEYGERRKSRFIKGIGRNFANITAAAVGLYYTLGESIMPYLLPGTADTNDIPAVVLTALASPFVANFIRKSWKNSWKDKLRTLAAQVNSERAYNG
jgi:hypothetical protein